MEKSSRAYEKLMKKIQWLSFFKQEKKAISILTKELAIKEYTVYEKSSGLIRLGFLYSSIRDHGKASETFDGALKLVKDKQFPYHPNFKKILNIFQQSNNLSLLEYWQKDFATRASYDKQFKKLVIEEFDTW